MREYKIIETNLGPMISHSRVMVYDVMLTRDEGEDIFFICVNYNLEYMQAKIALDYIEEHREQLEADLKEILPKKAERERHYREIQKAIRQQIAQMPMTPKRATFNALLEKSRRARGELSTDSNKRVVA
ncbi:MAG: hypothetical protein AAF639_35430 [Chloroflexota bacterium]